MTANPEHGFNNLAYSTTNAAISATATSIPLASFGGASFLSGWGSGKNLYLTLTDKAGDIEVVKVTDITNDTITVERGQDGTIARAWAVGAIVCQRGPATDFTNFLQKGVFLTDSVNPNGVYSVSYPGQKYYQNGATDCTKRWFIGISGTTWEVLAGDSVCFGSFTHQQRAPTTRVMRESLDCIAQNGATIIAAGYYGNIKSTDTGATYTAKNDGIKNPYTLDLQFANDIWVLAGSPYGRRSTDNGVTWQSFDWDSSYQGSTYRLKYLNSEFLMVGDNMVVQVSTSGAVWTQQHSSASNIQFLDIDYDSISGYYLVSAYDVDNGSPYIYQTGDLVTFSDVWTDANTGQVATAIVYGNGTWVCTIGMSGVLEKVLYSTDRYTWNTVSFSGSDAACNALIYENGLFVMLLSSDHIKTSSDGITWTDRTITKLAGHTDIALYSAIWTGSKYIAVGSASFASGAPGQTIVESTDGITWNEVAAPVARYDQQYETAITTASGLLATGYIMRIPGANKYGTYVEVGSTPSGLAPYDVTQSEDGLNVHAAIDTTEKYLCAAHSNFVANTTNDIFESTDGLTWTPTGKGVFGICDMAVNPAANGGAGLLIAVTTSGIWKNDNSLSSSGTSQTITGLSAQCVAFGNDVWVLAGYNGKIFTSPDGTNWTERTADDSYTGTFNSATYGDGQFVLVGSGGEIQYSSDDGITWHHVYAAGGYSGDFYSIIYGTLAGESFYLACGASGEIQTSSNGHTWTHHDADNGFTGSFRAAGVLTSSFVVFGDYGEIQSVILS